MDKSQVPQRRRLQFATRGIFMGTFWMAVFFGSLVLLRQLWHHQLVPNESETAAYVVIGCLLFVSLPAAIAGLFGRWRMGVLIGLALFCAYVVYLMVALSYATDL